MKRIVFIVVIILVFGGIAAIAAGAIESGELRNFCEANPSFLRFGIINTLCTEAKRNRTLTCSYETHACKEVIPREDSGNYKIAIMVNGKPGKGIEVDLGQNAGPIGDQYIKVTDMNGVALFRGIPPGTYYQGMNLDVFPKEYGDAYKSWTWAKVTIAAGKTAEMNMDLHSNPRK